VVAGHPAPDVLPRARLLRLGLPLGTLHHFFGHLRSERKRGAKLLETNRYKPVQTAKYYIPDRGAGGAAFGTLLIAILDPIALTGPFALAVSAAGTSYALNSVMNALYATGNAAARLAADTLQVLLQSSLVSVKQPFFRQAWFVGLLFRVHPGAQFPGHAVLVAGLCARWGAARRRVALVASRPDQEPG